MNDGKISKMVEKLASNRNIAYLLLAVAIIYSLIALSSTVEASLFEGADMLKLSMFASGASPYSTYPWLAPYPPLYFILWLAPYIAITSLVSGTAQAYFGFKIFSLIIVYLTAFLIYKSQVAEGKNRYSSITLSALFLIAAQYSLTILSGDSIGFLLLAVGAFFFIKGRDLLGISFVTLSVLFKIQPAFGLLALLVFFARNSTPKFIKSSIAIIIIVALFFVAPVVFLFPHSFQAFIAYDYNNLQLYNPNIYSAIAGLAGSVFNINLQVASQVLDYIWIITLIVSAAAFTYCVFRTKLFKNAKSVDILAVGMLIWVILFKQTTLYYFVWPEVVLASSGRLRSFLFLFAGQIVGAVFMNDGFALLSSTVNYSVAPPVNASLYFFAAGAVFVIAGALSLRQLLIEIKAQKS